jgi:hypothetical protein
MTSRRRRRGSSSDSASSTHAALSSARLGTDYELWYDARYEDGISPVLDTEKRPMGFDQWWLTQMRSHLERFERVLALMNGATPHEELHRALEPQTLQLEVDLTMASLMDTKVTGTPDPSS